VNLAEAYAQAGKALLDLADAIDNAPRAAEKPQETFSDGTPIEEPSWTETDDWPDTPQSRSKSGGCPVHGVPWTVKPAGTRKGTGEPYKAFWKCGEQDADGKYCREFPSEAWVKAHPIR
jgi:hypothetical protein